VQLGQLQEDIAQFQAYNAQIIALSVETVEQGQALKSSLGLTFLILPNPDASVINRYAGLEEGTGRAKPATFVIGRNGRVAWTYIGQDPGDRPTNEMILEALDRL
jgi:peroxiredoxin